jgi:hypothetical protein
MITDPSKFGSIWTLIHVMAKHATTNELKEQFIKFMETLSEIFMCEKCRKHIADFMQKNPIRNYFNIKDEKGNDIGMFKYTWLFHNAVNVRLKYPILDWNDALSMYDDSISVCNKGCDEDDDDNTSTVPSNKELLSKINIPTPNHSLISLRPSLSQNLGNPSLANRSQILVNPTPTLANRSQNLVNPIPSLINRSQNLINPTPNLVNRSQNLVNSIPSLVNRSQNSVNPIPSLVNRSQNLVNPIPSLVNRSQNLINSTPSLINRSQNLVNPTPINRSQTPINPRLIPGYQNLSNSTMNFKTRNLSDTITDVRPLSYNLPTYYNTNRSNDFMVTKGASPQVTFKKSN